MIRAFVADALAGLICLALLGFVEVMIGPTLTIILGGSAIVGLLVRILFRQRRKAKEDRDLDEWVRAERRARILSGRPDDVPLGHGLPVLLAFPDRAIIPTRDAHFGE